MLGWVEQLIRREQEAIFDSFPQRLHLIIAHINTETHNYNQTHEKTKEKTLP